MFIELSGRIPSTWVETMQSFRNDLHEEVGFDIGVGYVPSCALVCCSLLSSCSGSGKKNGGGPREPGLYLSFTCWMANIQPNYPDYAIWGEDAA